MIKHTTYKWWLVFLMSTIGFVVYFYSIKSTNHFSELTKVEQDFKKKEKEMNVLLQEIEKTLSKKSIREIPKNDDLYIHVYKQDTLIYWNTNKLPVSKFSDIHFPTKGITKAQNGWYYIKTLEKEGFTIAITLPIKNEYSYQNNYLNNDFVPPFKTKLKSHISLDQNVGFPIYNEHQQYLFSIFVNDYQPITTTQAIILSFLLLCSLSVVTWQAAFWSIIKGKKHPYIFPIILLGIRYISLYFSWTSNFGDIEIVQASLYGTSFFFPNLLDLTINVMILLVLAYYFYQVINAQKNAIKKGVAITLLIATYLTWFFVVYLFKGIIENSSIAMHIEHVFQLNIYSMIALINLAILGFVFFIITKTTITAFKIVGFQLKQAVLIIATTSVFVGVLDQLFINHIGISAIFPGIFILMVLYLEYKEFTQKHLIIGMLLLALYSLTSALLIVEFNKRKDKSERELYASQLVTERDINMEVEFVKIVKPILDDKFIQRMISSGKTFQQKDFDDGMERRHFNGFWEKYELNFYLIREDSSSVIEIQGNGHEAIKELEDIIQNNCETSEINPSIHYVKDYTQQYSYLIRQNLYGRNSEKATLYITLKSKKIPEEIGFPRLLISSQAGILKHLEKYSIAKYHNNKLVSYYGSFNYPSNFSVLNKDHTLMNENFNFKGYNHLVYKKSKDDSIILSEKNIGLVDIASSFSYLFCLFGLMLLPIYVRYYSVWFTGKNSTLAGKIQMTLIGIILVTLITIGVGSSFFVKNQYKEYSSKALEEKVHSVETEMKSKWGKYKYIDIHHHGVAMNYYLTQLSKTFNADINFYDPEGFLVSTSRQKIFNYGLLSEQINPIAKNELSVLKHTDFVNEENIGNLTYSSAYSSLYNPTGNILGYINLQQFGQQEEIENQIQQFIVSIVNVFVLLLALSAVFAILIANWITNPLRILKERISKINIQQSNQPIEYAYNDEIGELVNSYNKKIEELELAAQQLAQSERESAWRDMAKQIAHEIKNPLTPMKLSVQHLVRSFDPNDPLIETKIKKVSESLIEQIDSLAKIATEFSNFAKMPIPLFEEVDIVQVIRRSAELFQSETKSAIILDLPKSSIIHADKEQMLRVFNNLIKNAVQATSENDAGMIQIKLNHEKNDLVIQVKDNGIGMDEEELKKIFTPYFTTKSTGSGIGLAMVKQIITNHKGHIEVTSEKQIGTQFSIVLKHKRPD